MSAAAAPSQHIARDRLRAATGRGVEFHLIGPLRDDLPAEAEAVWHSIRPGTDVALMLGIGAHAGQRRAGTTAPFSTAIASAGRNSRPICSGDRRRPAERRRLGRRDLRHAGGRNRRRWRGGAAGRRTLITCAQSLQRAEHGEQPVWMGLVLAAMLGQIGLPGGGFAYALGSTSNTGKPPLAVPLPTLPHGRNSIADFIPVARIADLLLNPGEPFDYDGRQLTYPDIRLVYWAGGNPFHHHQDLNRLRRAFARPDTVIVHEFGVDRDRAPRRHRAAGDDHPGARGYRRLGRRPAAGGDASGSRALCRGARRPRDLRRARRAARLCRRLHRGPLAAGVARDRSTSRPAARLIERGVDAPDFEEFWEAGELILPTLPWDGGPLREFRRDPDKAPLPTPSGRIEITSATIAGFGYPDCPGHPAWLPPSEAPGTPAAARYPLYLVANQPATRLHSQLDFGATSQAAKVKGREPVRIHPQDAAARGIRDGDIVRLYNRPRRLPRRRGAQRGGAPGRRAIGDRRLVRPRRPGRRNPALRPRQPERADPRRRHLAARARLHRPAHPR